MKCALLAVGLVVLSPQLVRADPRGSFVVLDREGSDSAIGFDFNVLFPANATGFDLSLRENLWGRYVSPLGLGVYGQVVLSHLTGTDPPVAGGTGFGNLELGALYVLHTSPLAAATFRFGLGLPTASDGDGFAANVIGSLGRLHDLALAIPHSLWLRPGVGLRVGTRLILGQIDFGIDIPIKTEDPAVDDVQVHINAGLAIRPGAVAVTTELATLGSKNVFSNDFEFIHNFAVSLRYADGNIHPFIAYILPFQFGEEIPAHVLSVGVNGTF